MLQVAIIEDDIDQAKLVASWLKPYSYQLSLFVSAELFLEAQRVNKTFDLLIVDWMLPGMTGIDLMQEILPQVQRPAVMFMTTLRTDEDLALALHSGADDFVTKPLRQTVFIARLHALIRRFHALTPATLEPKNYQLDTANFSLVQGEQRIKLTASEFRLMQLFSHSTSQVFSREDLADSIWSDPQKAREGRSLDLLISRLRKKLQQLDHPPGQIVNHYGQGYTFEPEVVAS